MTLAVFHDFPGLENGLTKFRDFPWLPRKSGHPDMCTHNPAGSRSCNLSVTETFTFTFTGLMPHKT